MDIIVTLFVCILSYLSLVRAPSLQSFFCKNEIKTLNLQRSREQARKILNQGETMSNYYNEKSTSRFTFGMSRNNTAKQAGSNTVTIATNPVQDSQYSIGQTSLTMTVREAKALQSFLNDSFAASESVDI